jgi:uncharacterized HAD superfamily protein
MWIEEVEFPPPQIDYGEEWPIEPESPESVKAPVKTILRFGIDIDGTISRAPKHFKRLINALLDSGNLVYIVTARDAGRREETEQFLYSMGIRYTKLIMKPVDWQYSIPDFKVAVVQAKDLHMLIDDEEENCWAVEQRTRALAAHMLPAPPVLEEFEGLEDRIRSAELQTPTDR